MPLKVGNNAQSVNLMVRVLLFEQIEYEFLTFLISLCDQINLQMRNHRQYSSANNTIKSKQNLKIIGILFFPPSLAIVP